LASNSYQFKSIQAHSISSVRSSEPNVWCLIIPMSALWP
jgi:hypothetical protein